MPSILPCVFEGKLRPTRIDTLISWLANFGNSRQSFDPRKLGAVVFRPVVKTELDQWHERCDWTEDVGQILLRRFIYGVKRIPCVLETGNGWKEKMHIPWLLWFLDLLGTGLHNPRLRLSVCSFIHLCLVWMRVPAVVHSFIYCLFTVVDGWDGSLLDTSCVT